MFLDGVPLNPDGDSVVDLSTLPVATFDRMLVFRGFAPARYGSAAMGGFNPQSVGMNRVRAHRRMEPNLQRIRIELNGKTTRSLVCTRCQRTLQKTA